MPPHSQTQLVSDFTWLGMDPRLRGDDEQKNTSIASLSQIGSWVN